MFDQYVGGQKNELKINAVSGSILKNHPKSWFEMLFLDGNRAEMLFQEDGHKAEKTVYGDDYLRSWKERDEGKDIVVLQIMLCGNDRVLAECIRRGDYEGKGEGEKKC